MEYTSLFKQGKYKNNIQILLIQLYIQFGFRCKILICSVKIRFLFQDFEFKPEVSEFNCILRLSPFISFSVVVWSWVYRALIKFSYDVIWFSLKLSENWSRIGIDFISWLVFITLGFKYGCSVNKVSFGSDWGGSLGSFGLWGGAWEGGGGRDAEKDAE